MKTRVRDPLTAASETGGVTFEPKSGWWTYGVLLSVLRRLGFVFAGRRDALYIPTIQKSGQPVDSEVIEKIKAKARQLGLFNLSCARGMWVLSETGEAQVEVVWIAWAATCEIRDQLPTLAEWIRQETNQDSVAWEEQGRLCFTGATNSGAAGDEENLATENQNATWTVSVALLWTWALSAWRSSRKPQRIFVVPSNDGESVEIINLLQDNGECVLISAQPWGATWAGLEPEIVAELRKFRRKHPTGTIYGVELAGAPPVDAGLGRVMNVDHHRYANEDRTHPLSLSSIQQVGELIGASLSIHQEFVSANDVRYIPGMEALGQKLGLSPAEIRSRIEVVRAQDRAAQGVSPDDEATALGDLGAASWSVSRLGRTVVLAYTTPTTTAQADRLYMNPPGGERPVESLYQGPKWFYFGPRHRELADLGLPRSWSGGAPESGYFGVVSPDAEGQKKIMEIFNG